MRTESPATTPTPRNPAVGQLCKEGKTVWYAFINGVYTEDTIERLEATLAQQEGAQQ